ncbi:MAG: bifunctional acetate--CoA ligase family protein/GNAT family N-acetyltransferase, partial [Pseudomonadota bacterium]|nr:bifunctional acetate--CoA ligase family protein/GNAT family N-acetyltransferase [Pseudomonadota bacterium]
DIGFSHFVSLGNSVDVDFGDMLDYLAADPGTSAVLLYIEAVTQTRKFMSAARAASSNKPVIVIKAGRNAAGAKAAASHTGALIGSDAVYDVAFKRAGMLRVYEMEELFDAVETLARITSGPRQISLSPGTKQEQLVIVTNGGGPAVLATDYLVGDGGTLAQLSKDTVSKLDKVLPPTWSHGNPVDIIGDAGGERYGAAMEAIVGAPEAEALFVMKCPVAVSDNVEAARAVISHAKDYRKLLFTCWLGEATAQESRHLFAEAGIPTYDTPEKAMRAFLHIQRYRHNQAMLREAPPASGGGPKPDKGKVRAIIDRALAEGRAALFENEAKEVLMAYGIPAVKTVNVNDAEEAVKAAGNIGFPVALKIRSPDINHKSDVGGVILNLENAEAVRHAVQTMTENIRKLKPEAKLEGFNIEQMADREGYELIVGMSSDRQFGPVIMFGEGGVAVEVINDKALELPPLNAPLAEDMIKNTRIYNRLKGFRDRKPVKMEAIVNALVQVSQLVTDFAEINELDINPLMADGNGALALDARIALVKPAVKGEARLVISPYPQELEETVALRQGQRVCLRPVRPQDAGALADMIGKLTPHDLYHRFRGEYPQLTREQIARLTQIDYDRSMVLVVVPEAAAEIYGFLICTLHPGMTEAEFVVAIRSDMKGHGIGHALTDKLIRYLKTLPPVESLFGYALPGNATLTEMVKNLGFTVENVPPQSGQPPLVRVSRGLR